MNKPVEVMIAVCVHRHVDPQSWLSVLRLMTCPSPKFTLSTRRGDALIDRSRSIEATRFMNDPKYDVLLFIDDDIIFDPVDAARMCNAVADGFDICGGSYVLKKEGGGYFTTKFLKDDKEAVYGEGGGIKEVRAVATGFMAVSRRCVEAVAKTLPLCQFNEGTDFYPMFAPYAKEIDGKWHYLSEDWGFTEKARELGFKVYCDTSIKLGHAGRWVYDWSDFSMPKKEDKKTILYAEKVPG